MKNVDDIQPRVSMSEPVCKQLVMSQWDNLFIIVMENIQDKIWLELEYAKNENS
jgi:hypothetical protein